MFINIDKKKKDELYEYEEGGKEYKSRKCAQCKLLMKFS